MTSCSLFQQPVEIKTSNIEIPNIIKSRPDPIIPTSVNFKIYDYSITKDLNTQVENKEIAPYTLYALNENDLLNLGQWMRDTERFIKQQNELIDFYESVLKSKSKN
jgi:hypothetical protein